MSKALEIYFRMELRKPKKAPYICTPLRQEAKIEKRNEKRIKNSFSKKIVNQKNPLTFALPNRKKGNKTKEVTGQKATLQLQMEVANVL